MTYPSPQFTTPAIGDNSRNAATTAFVNSALGYLNGRNYIVDGNFDQFSASSAAISPSTGYVAPVMWVTNAGAGGAGTAGSAALNGAAYTANMTSPIKNALVFNQTTPSTGSYGAGTLPYLAQRVESAYTLAGQVATFSIWLWTNAGTVTVPYVMCRQSFGTGGSPSAVTVEDVAVNWTVTTTPQRFSVALSVPSVAGKTFGTAGNDYLQVGLFLPTGSNFYLAVAQAQLEQSSPQVAATGLPTAFEYRGPQAELARVQRYFQTISFYFTSYNSAGASLNNSIGLLTQMRATPACAFIGTPGTAGLSAWGVTGLSTGAANVTGTCSSTSGWALTGNFNADARL